jgi:hypothetical protein
MAMLSLCMVQNINIIIQSGTYVQCIRTGSEKSRSEFPVVAFLTMKA